MRNFVEKDNITEIYIDLLKQVSTKGELEGKTRDLVSVSFCLTDPTKNFLMFKKNWKWCFQELLDRMSGIFELHEYYQNPGMAYNFRHTWRKKMEKEGGRFDYSYGEAYAKQIPAIIKQLKKQKTSREAIISVWDRRYLVDQKNFQRRPCTLTNHLLIRNKKLYSLVNMRSNDLINLLPYDVFHHTCLQQYIADQLGLELGSYIHSVSHLYYPKIRERDGRKFIERTIDTLEERVESGLCHTDIPLLTSSELNEDFIRSIETTHNKITDPEGITSPLLYNMVKYVLDRSPDTKFTKLIKNL